MATKQYGMTDLIIPGRVIEQVEMSPEQLLVELAVYLYDKEILSMGKAKALAQLDLIAFQKELAKRDVYIKYDYEDLLSDLSNLADLEKREL